MGSKGSQTTTQNTTSAPDQQAYQAYSNILNRAQGVANTPYQGYGGELVAGINNQQNMGIQGINNNANWAQPYIQGALGQAQSSSSPLTQGQIQQYMSPYTQNVVDATQAQFNNQNTQASTALRGNAISQGAMGGNRVGVAQANLANQQQSAQAPVIAGLYDKAYNTGLSTAQGQQAIGLQGAGMMGNLGVAGQQSGLQGAGAQIGAGTLQQGTQQALDTANYGQFQNQQAFPYQQTQWLAGIGTGVGSQMGGTTSGQTTAPPPSPWNAIAGLAGAGIGAAGQAGMFSDERLKENVASIGKTHDGQTIYRYNFKGRPETHIGLMAGEVERHKPEAVGVSQGYKTVDYDKATEDAVAHRAHGGSIGFADGGWASGVAGVPYGGAQGAHGYVPDMNITRGAGAPHASAPSPANIPQNDLNKQAASVGNIANQLMKNTGGDANNGLALPYGSSVPGAEGLSSVGGSMGPAPLSGVMPTDNPMYGPGFAEGGSVAGSTFDTANFNERWNGEPKSTTWDHFKGGARDFVGGAYDMVSGVKPRSPIETSQALWDRDKRNGYAEGGPVGVGHRALKDSIHEGVLNQIKSHTIPHGYALGGSPDDDQGVVNPTEPYRMLDKPSLEAEAPAISDWRKGVDEPNAAVKADATPEASGVAPQRTAAATRTSFAPEDKSSDDLPSEVSQGYSARMPSRSSVSGVAPPEGGSSGVDFGKDSKLWPSLMSAGFATMASRSPFFGVAVGEGGQAGIQSYNQQQLRQQEAQRHAQQLELEREKFNRPYSEMTAAQKATMEHQKLQDKRAQQAQDRPYSELTAAQKALIEHQKTQDLRTLTAPTKLGVDMMGREIYGIRNQTGGYDIIDPKTGKRKPDTEGLPSTEGGNPLLRQPSTGPNAVPAKPQTGGVVNAGFQQVLDDPKLPSYMKPAEPSRNQEILDEISKDDPSGRTAAKVKGVANYSINPVSLPIKERSAIIGMAQQYDPSYDQTLYNAKQRAVTEFFAGGPQSPAGTMTAGNTAILHLGEMYDLVDQMDTAAKQGGKFESGLTGAADYNIPFISKAIRGARNSGSEGTGSELSQKLNDWQTAKQRFSEEVTKFYSSGAGSEAERERSLALLNEAKSPAELKSAIRKDLVMMRAKVEALQGRLISGMNPSAWKAAVERDPSLVVTYKNAREVSDHVLNDGKTTEKKGAPAAPAKPTLQQFLEKAGPLNPNMTPEQLTQMYNKRYGG